MYVGFFDEEMIKIYFGVYHKLPFSFLKD